MPRKSVHSDAFDVQETAAPEPSEAACQHWPFAPIALPTNWKPIAEGSVDVVRTSSELGPGVVDRQIVGAARLQIDFAPESVVPIFHPKSLW